MNTANRRLLWWQVCVATVVAVMSVWADPNGASGAEYLDIVRAYADAMIDHGRDDYGDVHSPLFAAAMDRETMKTDELYQKLAHDFGPQDIGFVSGCHSDTLEAFASGSWTHTQPWATRYGACTDAQVAMMAYLRWQQLPEGPRKAGYRRLALASADRYLTSMPDLQRTIYPGPLGDVIFHLLAAHELTGDKKYLQRADRFAQLAVEHFLGGDSPLPRASSRHGHYEAITRGDTLMMALLKLWQVQYRPDLELSMVYGDR